MVWLRDGNEVIGLHAWHIRVPLTAGFHIAFYVSGIGCGEWSTGDYL